MLTSLTRYIQLIRCVSGISILLGLLLCGKLSAQSPDINQKLSVNFNDLPLERALEIISDKSGVKLSYSTNEIDITKRINYEADNVKLATILNEVCSQAGIQFNNIGGYLVLKSDSTEIPLTEEKTRVNKYTIKGFVTDASNKEVLIGAAIYNPETGLGALTNNYGFFSLTLPEGSYNLKVSYLGYSAVQKDINLTQNQDWNINLQPTLNMVEEVVINSENREDIVFKSLAGQTKVNPLTIQRESATLGETDMLKSLDNIPGISFQGDGSSYFFVRGGNKDQNLILLDETPLYNPSHMLGLFTPIIPDAIKTTNVYKAAFPVQYGGRLSSIIDIRTKDGNKQRFSGSATMGLVSTRFSVEGPIRKDASSFFVSYRRSYFGWLFKSANTNIRDFYFNDFTTKFNLRLSKKDRLFVTLYYGQDKFMINESESLTNGLEWGNSSITIRWNHVFGERLFANTTLYSSNYEYFLHTDLGQNYYWKSHIRGTHLKSEFTLFLNPTNKMVFGAKIGGNFFNPGNYNHPETSTEQTVSEVNSTEYTIFAGFEHEFGERMQLNYGLRYTHWSDIGEAFIVDYEQFEPIGISEYAKGEKYYQDLSLEPRLALSIKTGVFASIKASYSRTLQHIHLINNSISPFNTLDVWLPSGPNIKPQKADIYDVGYVHHFPEKKVEFSFDVYYKKMYNQIGYVNHSELLLNRYIEGEIRQGGGNAYGLEALLKKSQGRFTGQIGYAYSRSFVQIDEINEGRTYKTRQDKPIDLTVSLSYNLMPRWLLSANFLYASGLATTTPSGFYNYQGSQVPVYNEINNDRLPNYRRFDLASDWRLNKNPNGIIEHHFILSLYNLFNYQNPAYLYFSKTVNANGELVIPADKQNPQQQTPSYRYIYAIIPSITYYLKF